MPLLSGGRYFRDLIGGQKINVTFGGAVTFGILRYNYYSRSPAVMEYWTLRSLGQLVLPQSLGTPLVEKDKGIQAAMKTSLENKHLGNDVYFLIITGLVEAPLKQIKRMKDLLMCFHVVARTLH